MGIIRGKNERSQRMKKYNSIICMFILVCAGMALVSCETTGAGAAAAAPPN
jgi:hypothetical protein